jgi:hypothetical protein
MTADERKRELRDAVQVKLNALRMDKADALDTIGANPFERGMISNALWAPALLWEIIDSLVDEADKSATVLSEFISDIEAVGPKIVGKDWPDLVVTYRKAKALSQNIRPADKEKA